MFGGFRSDGKGSRYATSAEVDMCKRVLEKMAMTMQLQKRLEIEASEFDEKLQLDEDFKVARQTQLRTRRSMESCPHIAAEIVTLVMHRSGSSLAQHVMAQAALCQNLATFG